ncbi:hypothetical protein D3C71_1299340 [compost metagenome]
MLQTVLNSTKFRTSTGYSLSSFVKNSDCFGSIFFSRDVQSSFSLHIVSSVSYGVRSSEACLTSITSDTKCCGTHVVDRQGHGLTSVSTDLEFSCKARSLSARSNYLVYVADCCHIGSSCKGQSCSIGKRSACTISQADIFSCFRDKLNLVIFGQGSRYFAIQASFLQCSIHVFNQVLSSCISNICVSICSVISLSCCTFIQFNFNCTVSTNSNFKCRSSCDGSLTTSSDSC